MNAVVNPSVLRPATPVRTPRVVVVDDSRASLTFCRRSLEPLEIDLVEFESPREGFQFLETHDADLVLLGNLMRETDGMTLLGRLRARPRHQATAVVIMSTKDYNQDRVMARELGALDYLVKPFHAREIRDVVTKYTGAQAREP